MLTPRQPSARAIGASVARHIAAWLSPISAIVRDGWRWVPNQHV